MLAVTGGGSGAIAALLEVPGASRTVLEAIVPYSEGSLVRWLGGPPDQACSAPTARAMAMAAFCHARGYCPAAGVAAGANGCNSAGTGGHAGSDAAPSAPAATPAKDVPLAGVAAHGKPGQRATQARPSSVHLAADRRRNSHLVDRTGQRPP